MKVAYLGPEGTFSHEALMGDADRVEHLEPLPQVTVYDAVMAVHERTAEWAFVPMENSIEGGVNATLDALAFETEDVAIVGEVVHSIRHCLVAREPIELEEIEAVVSHPQPSGQCARFLRTRLAGVPVEAASSTAEAVRRVAEATDRRLAALGTRLAAELYGCEVLRASVEDVADNETRFVWLAQLGTDPGGHGPWKTSLVFWGIGSEAPGWLVRCLSEFAFRGVNLTKIESRPRKQGLGRYMFFADLEGRESDPHVAEAIDGLRSQTERVRVLGSYPAAA